MNMPRLHFRCWLSALLLLGILSSGVGKASTESSVNPLWQKVVMVGASASAGFTVREPLGGTNTLLLRLNRHVDAALRSPHPPVLNVASSLFFLQPESTGRAQVSRALQEKPSLVLAVDFPFWFCYGKGTNDTDRLQRFEQGLRLLEPLTCPIVIGDLPDASAAVDVILRPDQMPSTNALAVANARLRTWATTRTNVTLVSLATLIQVAEHNRAFSLHGKSIPAGHTRALLQSDNLHPSPEGSAVIALTMLDALQSKFHFPDHEIQWDPAALVRAVRGTLPAPAGAASAAATATP